MAVVGSAEVTIRAITTQFRADLQRALQQSENDAGRSGSKAGDSWGKGFADGIKPHLAQIKSEIGSIGADAASLGQQAGDQYGSNFRQGASPHLGSAHEDVGSNSDASSIGEQHGRDYGDGFRRGAGSGGPPPIPGGGGSGGSGGANSQSSNAGSQSGNAFSNAFKKAISGGGPNWAQFLKIGILGQVVGIAVSLLSALAQGLFALAAAAAPAVNALAGVPQVITALAQGLGVGLLAFRGIGDAMKAFGQQQKATGAGAAQHAAQQEAAAERIHNAQRTVANAQEAVTEAIEQGRRRISDAEEGVARAHEDAADSVKGAQRDVADAHKEAADMIERANERVVAAEDHVRDAQVKVRQAQEDLNRAREDAAENLQDLILQLARASLNEEGAMLALERAQQRLQESAGFAPTSLQRREAELAFKEAEQSLAEIRERNEDLRNEYIKTDEARVDGSNGVVQAQNKIRDAEGDLVDAVRAAGKARQDAANTSVEAQQRVTDAQDRLAKTQRDSARDIASAERDLADARKEAADSVSDAQDKLIEAQHDLARALAEAAKGFDSGNSAANKFASSMAKLSPAGRDFVNFLIGLKPQMDALKARAQEAFLPGLQKSLGQLTGTYFPLLGPIIDKTGHALASFFDTATKAFTTPLFTSNFQTVANSNARVIEIFGKIFANFGRIVMTIMAVASPFVERFFNNLAASTSKWAAFTEGAQSTGKMSAYFERAYATAAQLWRIIKDVAVGLFNMGKAAQPAGQILMDSLERVTSNWRKFTGSVEGQNKMRDQFLATVPATQQIGGLVADLTKMFARLGAQSGLGPLVAQIRTQFLPVLEKVLASSTDIGPAFVTLATKALELFHAFQEVGIMKAFLDTLGFLLGGLTALMNFLNKDGIGADVGKLVGTFLALNLVMGGLPLSLVKMGLKSIGQVILRALMPYLFLAAQALWAFAGPILIIAALGLAFYIAYKKIKPFHDAVNAVARALADFAKMVYRDVIGPVIRWFQHLYDVLIGHSIIPDIINGIIGFFKLLARVLGPIIGAIVDVIKIAFKVAEKIIKVMLKIWGLEFKIAFTVIKFIVEALVVVIQTIATVIGAVVGFVKDHWQLLLAIFLGPLGIIIGFIVTHFNAIWNVISTVVGAIVNFVRDHWQLLLAIFLGPLGIIIGFVVTNFNAIWNVISTVVGAIVNFVRDHWQLLLAIFLGPLGIIIGFVITHFNAIWNVISTILNAILLVVQTVWNAIWGAISFVLNAIWTAIQFYWNLISGVVMAVVNAIWATISFVWNAIWATISFVLNAIWTGVQFYWNLISTVVMTVVNAIWATVSFVWNAIWGAISFVLGLIWNGIQLYFNLYKLIITTVINAVWAVISFVWNAIWGTIKFVLGLIIAGVQFYFNAIKAAIEFVMNIVWGIIRFILDGIKTAFNTAVSFIKGIWDGLMSGIRWVVDNILGPAFKVVGDMVNGVKTAFEKAKDGVVAAWNTVIDTVKRPIQGMIDFVYNNGIRNLWNRLAGLLHLPELGEIRVMATGGMVPGYAPGRDSVSTILSPGEGVLVPEAVRGIAREMGMSREQAIQYLNSKYSPRVRGGGQKPRYDAQGRQQFWGGGIVGDIIHAPGKALGAAVDWTKDLVLGGLRRAAELAFSPLRNWLEGQRDGSAYKDLLVGTLAYPLDKILDFLGKKDAEAQAAGDYRGPEGRSVEAIEAVMNKKPDLHAIVTSTTGGGHAKNSYHYKGMAVDFGAGGNAPGPLAEIAKYWFGLRGNLLELIHSGGGGFFVNKGKVVDPGFYSSVIANHFDHVHVAATKAAMDRVLGVGGAPGPVGDQLSNARAIGDVARSMGLDRKAVIIGLMTALQESGLRNINFGDRDSLGLFQQRPSQGWGSPAQILNPSYAARKFFETLLGVRGWHGMLETVAAQRVQRSAFPMAYQKWFGQAAQLASMIGFHTGGMVPGMSEQVALLLGGEGVLNRGAVALLGGAKGVDQLNREGMRTIGDSGTYQGSGGTTSTNQDAVINRLEDAIRSNRPVQVNVMPPPGTDANEVATIVGRELGWRL